MCEVNFEYTLKHAKVTYFFNYQDNLHITWLKIRKITVKWADISNTDNFKEKSKKCSRVNKVNYIWIILIISLWPWKWELSFTVIMAKTNMCWDEEIGLAVKD